MSALPSFVTAFRDRHGKARYRFRRAGFSSYLPSPDAAEFAATYEQLLTAAPPTPIRAPRSAIGQLRAALRRHGWPTKGEFVYFVSTRGLVKIGWSSAIVTRIGQLAAQSPTPLRLLAVLPGGRDVERKLHDMFAGDQVKGEWFRRSERLKNTIAAAKRGEHL